MDAQHHAIFALLFFALFYMLAPASFSAPLPLLLLMCIAAALLPDIDHPKSKASQYTNLFAAALLGILSFLLNPKNLFLASALFLILLLLYHLFISIARPPHRTITHTFLAAAIFSAVIFLLLSFAYASAALIGYLSHLIGDGEFQLW